MNPEWCSLIKLPTPSSGLEGSKVFGLSVWMRTGGERSRLLEANATSWMYL